VAAGAKPTFVSAAGAAANSYGKQRKLICWLNEGVGVPACGAVPLAVKVVHLPCNFVACRNTAQCLASDVERYWSFVEGVLLGESIPPTQQREIAFATAELPYGYPRKIESRHIVNSMQAVRYFQPTPPFVDVAL
jgi:hypothetical protein